MASGLNSAKRALVILLRTLAELYGCSVNVTRDSEDAVVKRSYAAAVTWRGVVALSGGDEVAGAHHRSKSSCQIKTGGSRERVRMHSLLPGAQ